MRVIYSKQTLISWVWWIHNFTDHEQ